MSEDNKKLMYVLAGVGALVSAAIVYKLATRSNKDDTNQDDKKDQA